jgi:hypothetical protein
MEPLAGELTSRSPSGVHVSSLAAGTIAQTSAVHPRGRVTTWGGPNTRLAAGTRSVTRLKCTVSPEGPSRMLPGTDGEAGIEEAVEECCPV